MKMKTTKWQELESRHERFIKDIAFIFLFDVLGVISIVSSLFVPVYELFLILAVLGAACIGLSIAHKLIMLHRIYRGTKWKKE